MKKAKRILALTGAILLVCLYAATLVFALMDSPAASGLLKAAVAATILVPVLLYARCPPFKPERWRRIIRHIVVPPVSERS